MKLPLGQTTGNGSFQITGAFSELERSYLVASGSSATRTRIGFNAHNSNTIYTDNGKVSPASIALNYIIKA